MLKVRSKRLGIASIAVLLSLGMSSCSALSSDSAPSEPTQSQNNRAQKAKYPKVEEVERAQTKNDVAKSVEKLFYAIRDDTSKSMSAMAKDKVLMLENTENMTEEASHEVFVKYYPKSLKLIDPDLSNLKKDKLIGLISVIYMISEEVDVSVDTQGIKMKENGTSATVSNDSISIVADGKVLSSDKDASESMTMKYDGKNWILFDYVE